MDEKKIDINNPKSKVGVYKCSSYDSREIHSVIEKILYEVIGIEKYIKSGSKVHIKPNLLSEKGPDKAVTTHPAVVKAVVKIIQSMGALVTIGDSPAGMTRSIEKNWIATGMKRVAEETGAQLVEFENKGVSLTKVRDKQYFIAKIVHEADVVVSISKLKTHSLTLMTGAIKNIFGVIPGIKKAEYHRQAPELHDFASILVDIFEAVKPQINIMDAIIGMEGNGPSSGMPVHIGYLLGSNDAVALDSIAAHLMGFGDDEVITTSLASERGLGVGKRDEIEIVGTSFNDLPKENIVLPTKRLQNYIPDFLIKFIGKLIWIRPIANKSKCRKCGLCIKNCPVNAMTPRDGIPHIDYNVCIKCFCCDEICPYGAIEQDMSRLVKLLS